MKRTQRLSLFAISARTATIVFLALVAIFFNTTSHAKNADSIVVNNAKIDLVVDKGQSFATQCFSFKAKVQSRVQGAGCKVQALEQVGMPFITVELINEMKGKTLDQAGDAWLDSIAANIAKTGANKGISFMNPGPLDSSSEGKYIGKKKITLDGLPAIEYRWAIGKKDNYRAIRVRTIVGLPKDRFVWDGVPIGYMLISGNELGFKAAMYNEARSTLDIL